MAVPDNIDLRVLIVEDQGILAMELEFMLADAGCTVVGRAMDRAGALEAARGNPPQLAFVDVNLLDGFTGPDLAVDLMREHGAAVVFVTANPELIAADCNGALGVVSKPFDDETIRGVTAFAQARIQGRDPVQPPRRFRPAPI